MKTLNTVLKVLTALATVAGAVYIVATYGDKIVEWAKKMLASLPKCPKCEEAVSEEEFEEAAPAAEEAPVEEAPAEEVAAEEVPAEEVVVEDNAPVAEDADFEA